MSYRVLSPDGFDIECGTPYKSRKKALEAFNHFKERYTAQGYYRTSNWRKIPLEDLIHECDLIEA